MGLFSGLFKGKPAKTTQTTIKTLPGWVKKPYKELLSRGLELSRQEYTPFQGDRIADLSPYEQQAISKMKGLADTPLDLSKAINMVETAGGGVTSEDIQRYQNPFLENVLDIRKRRALEDYDRQKRDFMGQKAQIGAFGGSRLGLQEAELQRRLQERLADEETMALSQGYQQALGAAERELGRRGGAGTGLAGLMGQERGAQIQDIAGLTRAGSMERGIEQAKRDADYEEYLKQQAYPYEQLKFLAGLTAPAAGTMVGGETVGTAQKAGLSKMGKIMAVASLAAAPFTGGSSLAFMPRGGGGGFKDGGVVTTDSPSQGFGGLGSLGGFGGLLKQLQELGINPYTGALQQIQGFNSTIQGLGSLGNLIGKGLGSLGSSLGFGQAMVDSGIGSLAEGALGFGPQRNSKPIFKDGGVVTNNPNYMYADGGQINILESILPKAGTVFDTINSLINSPVKQDEQTPYNRNRFMEGTMFDSLDDMVARKNYLEKIPLVDEPSGVDKGLKGLINLGTDLAMSGIETPLDIVYGTGKGLRDVVENLQDRQAIANQVKQYNKENELLKNLKSAKDLRDYMERGINPNAKDEYTSQIPPIPKELLQDNETSLVQDQSNSKPRKGGIVPEKERSGNKEGKKESKFNEALWNFGAAMLQSEGDFFQSLGKGAEAFSETRAALREEKKAEEEASQELALAKQKAETNQRLADIQEMRAMYEQMSNPYRLAKLKAQTAKLEKEAQGLSSQDQRTVNEILQQEYELTRDLEGAFEKAREAAEMFKNQKYNQSSTASPRKVETPFGTLDIIN